jgi:hypothetical protein
VPVGAPSVPLDASKGRQTVVNTFMHQGPRTMRLVLRPATEPGTSAARIASADNGQRVA